ncbi:hypothetical protein IID22_04775 [Patescibacteria group bacterium]|nr:hypothetical protein [Patescibacteria group bacterium]
MIDSKQGITPESLPSVTKLITSMREQKGIGKRAVQIINQALKLAKVQVKYLKKMSRDYNS